jgi:peptidoglycan/xylan/chitin deacetylase (PgdA/CDA1 family)
MRLSLSLLVFSALASQALAQTNRVVNSSFETADPNFPTRAANWSPGWDGYERVALSTGNWDGAYALRLTGPSTSQLGAVQRVTFNQTSHIPILITARLKFENIGNVFGDNLGASFDCRVKFMSLSESQLSFCPATAKTKNVGTSGWTYIGFNTAHLVNGNLPIEWVEVRLRRGAVSGTAWFDAVRVSEYPYGSFTGAVTMMFDDGYIEQYEKAYKLMQARGLCGVEAAVVNYLNSTDPAYMRTSHLKEMAAGCWEVVSHSMSHRDMTTLSPVDMEDEYFWSKKFFVDNGFNVKSFALPFGAYNARVLSLPKERSYFTSVRKTEKNYNPMGAFPYDTKVQEVNSNTTLSQVQAWIDEARNRKAWLILLFHKIRSTCPDFYCTSDNTFNSILTAVQGSGLPVVTYEQGLNLVKSPH